MFRPPLATRETWKLGYSDVMVRQTLFVIAVASLAACDLSAVVGSQMSSISSPRIEELVEKLDEGEILVF